MTERVFPIGREHGAGIRRGGELHELDGERLAVWTAARGDTWADLMRRLGTRSAASHLDALLDRGLLVEVEPASPAAVAFARTHRAVPTSSRLVRDAVPAVVRVSRPVYEVWVWGHVNGDMWRACQAFTDPPAVLTAFLAVLPALLRAGAVYLDTARKSYPVVPSADEPA